MRKSFFAQEVNFAVDFNKLEKLHCIIRAFNAANLNFIAQKKVEKKSCSERA